MWHWRTASELCVSRPLLAVLLGVTFTPCVIAVLRRMDVLDHPNERSSHDRAVPRGAGLAPALAIAASLLWLHADVKVIVVLVLLFGAIGLADDFTSLPAGTRLALQVLSATAVTPLLPLPGSAAGVLF